MSNSGTWEYWASKAAIRDIEERDLGFLVEHGIANLESDGERIRKYVIYLKPGLPNLLKEQDTCRLYFFYGPNGGKARMWCKQPEFESLSKFLLGSNGHKHARCWDVPGVQVS